MPVELSGTAAQSPSAHTPRHPTTSMYWSTTTLPCSFLHGSSCKSGLGEVPAVQKDIKQAFVDLLDRVVRESAKSAAPPASGEPAVSATATQLRNLVARFKLSDETDDVTVVQLRRAA